MSRNLTKTGLILFFVVGMSKMAAFFLMVFFAFFFKTGVLVDAYYAAGIIPAVLNNALAICVMKLFIPVYTKCRSMTGEMSAWRFASNMLNISVIFNVFLFIVVCIASNLLATIVAPGFTTEGLDHTRRMICLLSMSLPFTVATYVLNNIYYLNNRYILPAVLTIFNHIFVITFMIVMSPRFGIYAFPFICTVAWLIQLVILVLGLKNIHFKYTMTIDIHDDNLKYMLKSSIPTMISTAGDQMELAVDSVIGSDLPAGSVGCLGYAQRISSSISGITSDSILTMFYPILSKQYADGDKVGQNNSLRKCFEIITMLTMIITTWGAGNAKDIMSIIFNIGGDMSLSDVTKISNIFTCYIFGLFFLALKALFTQLFFIKRETIVPAIINILCAVANAVLSLLFKTRWDIYGIAIATTVSIFLFTMIEAVILIGKTGGVDGLKKRQILRLSGVWHPILASMVGYILMSLTKSVVIIDSAIMRILISSIAYAIAVSISLRIFRNEYFDQIKKSFLYDFEKGV